MKKWYKSPLVKGILVLAFILSVGGFFAGGYAAAGIMASSESYSLFQEAQKKYIDSTFFENHMHMASMSILTGIKDGNNFETDGKYDENKIIDIKQYTDSGVINGENQSGFAYRLGDLVTWSNTYNQASEEQQGAIVVCQKMDGTYYYFYIGEFRKLMQEKMLFLEDVGSISAFLSYLEEGYGYEGNTVITDIEGNAVFKDCWAFNESIPEPYTPEGAANILEIANNNPNWNGKLTEMYEDLKNILYSLSAEVESYNGQGEAFLEGNTNLSYLLIDLEQKRVQSNRKDWSQFDDYEKYLKEISAAGDDPYCIIEDKLKNCKSNLNNFPANDWKAAVEGTIGSEQMKHCIFAVTVDHTLAIPDDFYVLSQSYEEFQPYRIWIIAGFLVSGIFLLIAVVWLTVVAGRKTGEEALFMNGFDRIPTEIAAVGVLGIWLLGSVWLLNAISLPSSTVYYHTLMGYSFTNIPIGIEPNGIIKAGIFGVWTGALFIAGYLSLVRRIKEKSLWKNSVLRRFWLLSKTIWKNRSITFKVLMVSAVVCMWHWFLILYYSYQINMVHGIAFFMEAAVVIWLLRSAIAKDRIQKGINEIASGNLEYQLPLEGMRGDYRDIAERINNIGGGLQKSVEKSMRDERLKTDLITNVSHDIKTPLTSIINYVDLLKRENPEDPKIQNYLDILEKKSQRLKQLTEDVVEASKVSSGNITLERMNLNLVEMIHQTEGEFQEKFAEKELQSVVTLPEEPAMVYVDGRRMWRILENIYNNAAKYAMPGTRVYADLDIGETEIMFSLKNISEQPLNISADELTERFIRGDLSRSTEGSGLGLSIAKSLTTLQGGDFHLYLDGDLFRVTISFPKVS